jgi:hypothetical protein
VTTRGATPTATSVPRPQGRPHQHVGYRVSPFEGALAHPDVARSAVGEDRTGKTVVAAYDPAPAAAAPAGVIAWARDHLPRTTSVHRRFAPATARAPARPRARLGAHQRSGGVTNEHAPARDRRRCGVPGLGDARRLARPPARGAWDPTSTPLRRACCVLEHPPRRRRARSAGGTDSWSPRSTVGPAASAAAARDTECSIRCRRSRVGVRSADDADRHCGAAWRRSPPIRARRTDRRVVATRPSTAAAVRPRSAATPSMDAGAGIGAADHGRSGIARAVRVMSAPATA